ncbi:MAG: ABC transporter permease subunit [Candidatus Limnocylindrales bacterium]
MSATGRWAELVVGPIRASWRAAFGWAITFVLLIVSTVAFWPLFKGSSAIDQALGVLPPAILKAFGLQDFATAAGYLRGGLYEIIVPLMFAAAGVMFANSLVAADEDAGRMELLLAQPVTRRAFLAARSISVLAWLAILGIVVLLSQLASDAVFDLQIGDDRVVATVVLSALLGAFYAGLAVAVAGFTARPGLVLSVGLGLALVGYLVAALFPLSDVLLPWRQLSPWAWALSGDPLVNASEPWRYLALAVPATALAVIGILAFERRDIRSA